jgi:hypothetical protein
MWRLGLYQPELVATLREASKSLAATHLWKAQIQRDKGRSRSIGMRRLLPQKSHGLHSVTGHVFMDGAVGLRVRRPCRLRFLLVSAIVATLKCAAQLRPCGRYAAGYGLARAIMNDAMVKKIAAVKVMVTRGSHVCA